MKKLFYFAMAACVAVCNVSCGSDDDDTGLPPEGQEIVLPVPAAASQAAAYVFPDTVSALVSGDVALSAINFTESGKAIIEVITQGGAKFVTYNADYANGVYTITDNLGTVVGTVADLANRSTSSTSLDIEITINIPGIGTLTFHPASPVVVQKVVELAASASTVNISRTWKVTQMNLTLEGDVDLSKREDSGNLKVFADAAQEEGAGLTDDEYNALCKTIETVSLDKTGLFSIQYSDGASEGCSWVWTDENAKKLQLSLRDHADFGNKFLSDASTIKVDFNPVGATFTLNTEIKGSKTYKATLTIVLK